MSIAKIAAVVAALTTILGAAWALDQRWVHRQDFAELGKSFQRYQVEQSIDKTTDRIWSTEDRLKKQPTNEELQQQKRELEERKRRLEQQLKSIDKGGS
jgi:predicted outer membrane protein